MHQDWHTFTCTGHEAVMTYENRFLSSTYTRLSEIFLYWYFNPLALELDI